MLPLITLRHERRNEIKGPNVEWAGSTRQVAANAIPGSRVIPRRNTSDQQARISWTSEGFTKSKRRTAEVQHARDAIYEIAG